MKHLVKFNESMKGMTLMWNILKIVLLSSSTIRILYRKFTTKCYTWFTWTNSEEISDFIKCLKLPWNFIRS
jgi:hypothetical protein